MAWDINEKVTTWYLYSINLKLLHWWWISLYLLLCAFRFTHLTTLAVVFHPIRRHLWALLHLWRPQQALPPQVLWWLLLAPRPEGQVEHQSLDFNLLHTYFTLTLDTSSRKKKTALKLLDKTFPQVLKHREMHNRLFEVDIGLIKRILLILTVQKKKNLHKKRRGWGATPGTPAVLFILVQPQWSLKWLIDVGFK